jgi:maltooligosyltrehalose trehalohydrolase
LTENVCFNALKLAAATVILSPFIPLIFMGEEYGETAPFAYFISHSDSALIEAVRRGRREEFAAFQWQGEIPDPQDEATFLQARLRHEDCHDDQRRVLRDFYKKVLQLRKTVPALAELNKEHMNVIGYEDERILFVQRRHEADHAVILASFGAAETSMALPIAAGKWRKLLDSAEKKWRGGGSFLPDELDSTGAITLTLSPSSVVVLNRRE